MPSKSYPQLGTLASVNAGDLFAGYRGSGPLKTYTAAIVKAFMSADSLPLAGGALTGVLKLPNGTEAAPALSFASEAATGLYRSGSGNLDVAILGTRRLNLSASGLNIYGACAATGFTGPLTGNVIGNLTGNVTGDVSGNAGTATKWATARSFTGDVTATGVDGSGNVATTLATTQSAVHTWSALQTITGGVVNGSSIKSADYTLAPADAGKVISFTSNSGITLTLPAGATPGQITKIVNGTGSDLTIAGDGTSNVSFMDTLTSTLANSRTCWCLCLAANIWVVSS